VTPCPSEPLTTNSLVHLATHYYLESDGQVFLVRRRKRWTFPTDTDQLPCRFEPVSIIPVGTARVLFAKPLLSSHPVHWHHKDHVIGRADVDPKVQQAINRTLARGTAKVILIQKGCVLMVKASRGYSQNKWNLPGGFLGYGEHPEVGAMRETEEEIGAKIRITRLVGIYSDVFPKNAGYFLSFVYLAKLLSQTLRPRKDEIDEIRWIPIAQALRECQNTFAHSGLRAYLKKNR